MIVLLVILILSGLAWMLTVYLLADEIQSLLFPSRMLTELIYLGQLKPVSYDHQSGTLLFSYSAISNRNMASA